MMMMIQYSKADQNEWFAFSATVWKEMLGQAKTAAIGNTLAPQLNTLRIGW